MDASEEIDPAPARAAIPSLPRTLYLWLALLVAAFVLPPLLDAEPRSALTSARDAPRFEESLEIEQRLSAAFSLQVLGVPSARRMQAERALLRDCRALALRTGAPGMARRTLIAAHAFGAIYDPSVEQDLAADLQRAGRPAREIAAERQLWQALYAPSARGALPRDAEARIAAMPLGFLKSQAQADLAIAQGETEKAEAARQRLRASVIRTTLATTLLSALFLLTALVGLGLLSYFLLRASRGDWARLGRVGTEPQTLGWGTLLDAFVFYLMLTRVAGVLGGMALKAPSVPPVIPVLAATQWSSGLLGILYLTWTLHRHRASPASLGITLRRLPGDIGYGIAGYAVALPLVAGMSYLSRLLFHQSALASAPNPILPLLASEKEAGNRLLIFIMATLAAPLFEEIFFRGTLFTALRGRLPWAGAALASAALFAVAHPLRDWLPILALGFVLAALREMRQSLVPGIVAHLLQNAIAYLLLSSLFTGG